MTQLALVTGASRGLGAAVAEELADRGLHVVAVARTSGALEELDDRIQAKGGQATLVPMDVTDAEAQKRMCAALYERWGGLDLWVHTAVHVAPLSPVNHLDTRDFSKSIATNVTATQDLIVNVTPLLLARDQACAIWTDDPRAGTPFFGAYGASKAAQAALFHSFAAEQAQSALDVIRFEPAPMPTATRARFFPGEDRSTLASLSAEAKRLVDASLK